ncbi:MAG: hypothetical protein KIH64_001965 [Mycobacterium sp.]|nr:hypothetical protein [Mycobacterium sp.]
MCRAVKCRVCGKTTWSGCGNHVDMVRRSVPASEWCGGKHSSAEMASASASAAPRRGWMFWKKNG